MSAAAARARAPLVPLGAGGHGRVVAELARAAGWTVEGFLDPGHAPGTIVLGAPVLAGDVADWAGRAALVAAIGDNGVRRREHARILAAGADCPALVHPSAVVSPSADLGPGAVVMAGAVVQAGARIGAAAVINTGACVDHDCDVGEAALVGPGAALCGGVIVGAEALVGAGAAVAPGVRIGAGALVGVGASVRRDVPAGARMLPWRP